MPWLIFFATRDDLLELLGWSIEEQGFRVLEAYSRFDQLPRQFTSVSALDELEELGSKDGPHLALWHPSASPPPRQERVQLEPGAVPGHTHRYVMHGAGNFTLQCSGLADGVLTASSLGWWTAPGARERTGPSLGATEVNWPNHAALGRKLRYHITKRLARATAAKRPVLANARELAAGGTVLRDGHQPLVNLALDLGE